MNVSGSAYAGRDFEYDVFVSYAWVNNDPDGPGGTWVSDFRKRLGRALDERLGRTGCARFFFDRETLGKHVQFGTLIEDALRKSAVMVIVLSKGYVSSPACKDELQFFDEAVLGGAAATSGRLFVVWYDDRQSHAVWPAEFSDEFSRRLQGVIGYEFFASLPAVPSGRPCQTTEPEYQTSLLQLTTAMAGRLAELSTGKSSIPGSAGQPSGDVSLDRSAAPLNATLSDHSPAAIASAGSQQPTILIAQSLPDRGFRKRRRQLADWCRSVGCHVLGETEYATSSAAFAEGYRTDLEQADVVVQLFNDAWLPCDSTAFPDGLGAVDLIGAIVPGCLSTIALSSRWFQPGGSNGNSWTMGQGAYCSRAADVARSDSG